MSPLLLFSALVSVIDPTGFQTSEACAFDQDAALALSARDFDQGEAVGWRPLAETPECRAIAAELIRLYRRTNWRSMTTGQVHSSYWHEGQMRAASGDNERAVPLLMAGTNPSGIGQGEYELGTIAFLRDDLPGLLKARERLAALPLPEDWDEMRQAYVAADVEPQWPPNLDVLDRLIACYGKPYDQAYAGCSD